MANFARHAPDQSFHNQNQKYAYHRLPANYEAGLGGRLDIPRSSRVVFGDYYEVLLFHQVRSE